MPQSFDWARPRRVAQSRPGTGLLRCVSFSPDGLMLLGLGGAHEGVHVFGLPHTTFVDAPPPSPEAPAGVGEEPPWEPLLSTRLLGPGYDAAWLPGGGAPLFAASCGDGPLRLVSALDGGVHATYIPWATHSDTIARLTSVAWAGGGGMLLGGGATVVYAWDASRPGLCTDVRPTSPSRKSGVGVRGLVSALDGSVSGSYAAGFYAPQSPVQVFDLRNNGVTASLSSAPTRGGVCVDVSPPGEDFVGRPPPGSTPSGNGVTQLRRVGQHTVLVGTRKGCCIGVHDLRLAGRGGSTLLYQLGRDASTPQRVQFDVTSDGATLVTGSREGRVHVYDLTRGEHVASPVLGADAVSGVALHPFGVAVVAAHGQRHSEVVGGGESGSEEDAAPPPSREDGVSMWRMA